MTWTLPLLDNDCYVLSSSVDLYSCIICLIHSACISQHTTYTHNTCILFIYL